MRKIIRFVLILSFVFLFVIVVTVGYFYISSKSLTINEYTVEESVTSSIRILQLSDLHSAEFGDNNEELIYLVKKQSPDLIVMSGDMINRDEENLDIITDLISSLSDAAPIYYGYGNHEVDWIESFGTDLEDKLTQAGAVVLNNSYRDVSVNDSELRIGGYMGYYRQPGMLTQDEEQKKIELDFANDFENTDRLKILINHIPTQWVDWDYINIYPVDIVFSGHYHGGAIRIPIIDQGLYAPYVGWFPPYTKGLFSGTQAKCVLSTGLGSEHNIPRLNNPPEIVIVDVVPYTE